jgi:hypothetical protein
VLEPSALGGVSRLAQLLRLPQTVAPDVWLRTIYTRIYCRRVIRGVTIQVDRYPYRIGTAYARQLGLVHVDAQQCLQVTHEGQMLHTMPVGWKKLRLTLTTTSSGKKNRAMLVTRYSISEYELP